MFLLTWRSFCVSVASMCLVNQGNHATALPMLQRALGILQNVSTSIFISWLPMQTSSFRGRICSSWQNVSLPNRNTDVVFITSNHDVCGSWILNFSRGKTAYHVLVVTRIESSEGVRPFLSLYGVRFLCFWFGFHFHFYFPLFVMSFLMFLIGMYTLCCCLAFLNRVLCVHIFFCYLLNFTIWKQYSAFFDRLFLFLVAAWKYFRVCRVLNEPSGVWRPELRDRGVYVVDRGDASKAGGFRRCGGYSRPGAILYCNLI